MNWSTRQLEINDVPILLDWYNNVELHYIANAKKYKPYTLEQLTDYWWEKLSRSNATYYVILFDGSVVGRVGLKKKEKDVEYSILIGIPTLYSKGLGTQVTKYFIAKAFCDPDVMSVYLNVRSDNLRAIKCYENAGFKTTKDFYENHTKMFEMRIERG
ncbi:GNAT family N-acetyltransferase [Neobacillus niacini]|uniref:GNAT family N-acetyltransferase n=1 Tax=Neobacillus niacini TaxID=86668 RepID=UPI003B010FA2